jgi:hypothetical protein
VISVWVTSGEQKWVSFGERRGWWRRSPRGSAAAVPQKAAAQAVPVIGAAGGAAVNVLFINHFQDMARGHFIVRRLERAYSPEFIRAEYERL